MPLCAFCGSSNHYLCPFKNNEDLFVVPDEYDENIKDFTFENQNQKNKNKNINKKINRNNSESLLNFFFILNFTTEFTKMISATFTTENSIFDFFFCYIFR